MQDKTKNIISWVIIVIQFLLIGFSAYDILPMPFLTDASIIGFVILLPFALIAMAVGIIITIIMLVLTKKQGLKPQFIINIILIILYAILIFILIFLLISGSLA